MYSNKNPTGSTVSAMISIHLSPAAPEQFDQSPESHCFQCKQGTFISHHDRFPGRATGVYYKPQPTERSPFPLLVRFAALLTSVELFLIETAKGSVKLGSCADCNSKQAQVKEMPISSFPSLQCC